MSGINSRLKRITGQVNGLIKMIDDRQDCEKIITQFQATKAAFDSAYAELLQQNLETCIKSKNSSQMNKIVKLISKS